MPKKVLVRLLIAAGLIAGSGAAFAQTAKTPLQLLGRANPQLLECAGLTEQEAACLLEIQREAQAKIEEAQAEIDIFRAQLRRTLLPQRVNLGEVERLLRDALEWEVQLRLAEIRREVLVREALSEETCRRMLGALRRQQQALQRQQTTQRQQAQRPGAAGPSSGQEAQVRELLLQLLRALDR